MENTLHIENSLELLTQEEWDRYLAIDIFDNMKVDINRLNCSDDEVSKVVFTSIMSIIQSHNNKVGSIQIAYALCKHYYDKGIPDNEWHKSPGDDGSSVQYMPHFEDYHYLRRYWFCFYSESLYAKLFSIWDSIYRFINNYYELGVEEKVGFIKKVLKSIETERVDLYNCLSTVPNADVYVKASEYRNDITHGISPNEIRNELVLQRNVETEIMKRDDDGNFIPQKVIAKLRITGRVGDYVTTKEILENVEAFVKYTGDIIQSAVALIAKDEFVVKI